MGCLLASFWSMRASFCWLQPSSCTTKSFTDSLQRVMNAAARVVSDTRKFDHGMTQILHDDLHWLDVADRVTYKLGVLSTSYYSVLSAYRDFVTIALYKFTFTIPYHYGRRELRSAGSLLCH